VLSDESPRTALGLSIDSVPARNDPFVRTMERVFWQAVPDLPPAAPTEGPPMVVRRRPRKNRRFSAWKVPAPEVRNRKAAELLGFLLPPWRMLSPIFQVGSWHRQDGTQIFAKCWGVGRSWSRTVDDRGWNSV